MDWEKLIDHIKESKENFKKSYKCLTQNRSIQAVTINKNAQTLVNSYNEVRELIQQNRKNLDSKQCAKVSELLVALREKLILIKNKFSLQIEIPTIVNTPLTINVNEESTDSDEENTTVVEEDIKEEDLHDLTIPATLVLKEENTTNNAADSENTLTMADQAAAIRSYIKEVACAVPEFDGQKIHLQRFIKAIKLVDLAKGPFVDIAVEVIKSKIVGTILNSVDNEMTIPAIINKLQKVVVGETSSNVKAKLLTVQQRGKTATQFTAEVDRLRKLLEASFIDEGIPLEHATSLSTKEAIDTMINRAEHESIKTVLEAGTCTTMDAAISAYIRTSARVTGDINKVMYFRGNRSNRGYGNANRGSNRGRGFNNNGNRGNYNNGNQNNGYQNNGYQNRYNGNNNRYNGNNRGRNNGNRGRNNNQNNNNGNNANVRVTQDQGNSQQPLGTQ